MSQYIRYPASGGVPIYSSLAAFPATATTGSLGVDASTGNLYEFNGASWILIGGPSSALALGNLDAQAATAQGAALVAGVLSMQSADATHPGLINTTTQSLAGNKTFTGTISASNLSGTNTGDVTLTAVGSSPNANSASLSGQALTLQPANATNPGILSTSAQDIPGPKTFLEPIVIESDVTEAKTRYVPSGVVAPSNPAWETGFRQGQPYYSIVMDNGSTKTTFVDYALNGIVDYSAIVSVSALRVNSISTIAGAGIMDLTVAGQSLQVSDATDQIQLAVKGNATQTANIFDVLKNDNTVLFSVNNSGNGVLSGTIAASNFSGSSSGTNTGDVTLTAVGASPSANGATLSGQALTLQPADATHPGLLTSGSQAIGGAKTFSSTVNADGGIDRSTSGTLTIGATNSTTINIGNSGATVNIQGTTIYENTPQLNVADPLITINSGGGAGSGQNSGIQIEENLIITGYAETSADRNSWILKAPNTAGVATITAGAGGITLNQSSHDPITLAAVGSSPNANGASLSTQVLNLQPADGTNPGVITAGTQTIGGAKTFSGGITATVTGTASGNTTYTPNNHGVVLSSATNAMTVLAPDASTTKILISGGSSADPTWGTEIQATIPTQAISASAIDWSTGNVFTKTLGANTVFTFSNQISGQTIIVRLTNTASNYTVTWPTVRWSGGAAPTMTVGAKSDIYTFINDGSNIYGSAVQDMS